MITFLIYLLLLSLITLWEMKDINIYYKDEYRAVVVRRIIIGYIVLVLFGMVVSILV